MEDKKDGDDHVSHEVPGLGDCAEAIIWFRANIDEKNGKKHWFEGKGSKNRDLHLKHGILDEELEHSLRIKDIIGKPSHEQGCPMPNGKMTVIMTTTFFLEPGVSFCYVSLKIKGNMLDYKNRNGE